jgi:alkylation response protein AidB-like acyl-CoA dehydrogenase
MRFALTEEQQGFARSLDDLLGRADSVAVARAWAAGDTAPGLALWKRLADQGVHAIVVPEEQDGMGGSAVDLVVAFEALGRHLAVGPWVASAAYAPAFLSALGEAGSGARLHAVAVEPEVPFALDADVAATCYLVREGVAWRAEPGDLLRSVDTTRRLFPLIPTDELGAVDPATLATAFDLAALACAAELLGCGERLLADTVAYVQQRRQYGRTIGSFQAVKHQLADVRIALDFARPLVLGAAAGATPVAGAKIAAGEAAYLASRVALQLHGAVGYTAELDLGLWINRVRALVGSWGTAAYHRGRLADTLLGAV